jgi:hypothetical protein
MQWYGTMQGVKLNGKDCGGVLGPSSSVELIVFGGAFYGQCNTI